MGTRVIKTLIVDDEPIARQLLREELQSFPGIAIVGEAENGRQALAQIKELTPDLVFLDLQMPVMGGFEVVRSLGRGGRVPIVVIVTAYDEHAIEAFDAGAVDYLLKPVSTARLQKAVARAMLLRNSPLKIANDVAQIVDAFDYASPSPTVPSRKIVGKRGSDYFLLNTDEVLAFQAEGELIWIVTAKQRLLSNETLTALEVDLQQQPFQRVHRNALVNVNHVRKITALSSQRWLLTLSNGLQIVVSKRQAHSVRKFLNP
ncbi:MAG TPA: LytTR family DNA-binding domain-containing protein [Bryobacteraceae bacterium]|jgi:DNA-binding LytR/AlgR family response regulator